MIKDKDKDKDMDTDEDKDKETGVQKFESSLSKTKPTDTELMDYFTELGRPDQAAVFNDYYASNGWKVGKNAMKDWKATARNWVRRATPLPAGSPAAKINRSQTVGEVADIHKQFAELRNQTNTSNHE
jgi:hypothetical protein